MARNILSRGTGTGVSLLVHGAILMALWGHMQSASHMVQPASQSSVHPLQVFMVTNASTPQPVASDEPVLPVTRARPTGQHQAPVAKVSPQAMAVEALGVTSAGREPGNEPVGDVALVHQPSVPVSVHQEPAVSGPVVRQAAPDYRSNPPPEFPMLLREQGMGGVVWLRVWVDESGQPGKITLLKGSGYRLLDESALKAVRQWRFIPAMSGPHPFASWVEFPVRFVVQG